MNKARWVSAAAGTALVSAMFALPGAGVAYASGNGNGNTIGNGNVSLLSGNTVNAPVSAPVNLCGISLALLGFSNAACVGGASSQISGVGEHSHNGNITGNYNVPVGSGNTLNLPVSAPLNVCGDSVAAGGYADSDCQGGSHSCIGEHCGQKMCQGSECKECHGTECHQCQGNECTMCTDHSCTMCTDHSCNVCTNHSCNVCTGHSCNVCTGSQCHQCQGNCRPNVPATPPPGTGPGTTTVTTATQPTGSGLPTTGADLLLLGVAALGSIGVGAGTVALARRRRNGEAS